MNNNKVEITITKKYTYVVDGLSENEAWDIVNDEHVRDSVAIETESNADNYDLETLAIDASILN
tara:strand:+ start:961 stop:1152 length:192 start_codon:yes stop_codon:yes gene_type:complete